MAKTNRGDHNVEFLLKEDWELKCWDPAQSEVIACTGNRWGVMDWSIQTLVAISDSKYWAEEWLRQQEGRCLETQDIPDWIEDASQEIKRLKAVFGGA